MDMHCFSVLFNILLIFVGQHVVESQRGGIGDCPRVQPFQSFDSSQFLGIWYVVSSYPDKAMLDARCASIIISWPAIGTNTSELSIFKKVVSFGKEKKYLGSASTVAPGVLGINYPALQSESGYYSILDTDYYNYAVMFTCSNYFGFVNGQSLQILGRKKFLEPQYMQKALTILNVNNLSRFLLRTIDQGCNNPFPYPNIRKRR